MKHPGTEANGFQIHDFGSSRPAVRVDLQRNAVAQDVNHPWHEVLHSLRMKDAARIEETDRIHLPSRELRRLAGVVFVRMRR